MKEIIEGFLRFQKEIFPERVQLLKKLSRAQAPTALFVTCSDTLCKRFEFSFCMRRPSDDEGA